MLVAVLVLVLVLLVVVLLVVVLLVVVIVVVNGSIQDEWMFARAPRAPLTRPALRKWNCWCSSFEG